MPKDYLNLPAGRTIRLSHDTNFSIAGVHVEVEANCRIIIISKEGKNGTRFSISKVDNSYTKSECLKEIKWVGSDSH